MKTQSYELYCSSTENSLHSNVKIMSSAKIIVEKHACISVGVINKTRYSNWRSQLNPNKDGNGLMSTWLTFQCITTPQYGYKLVWLLAKGIWFSIFNFLTIIICQVMRFIVSQFIWFIFCVYGCEEGGNNKHYINLV
jgi:hypothetical protein